MIAASVHGTKAIRAFYRNETSGTLANHLNGARPAMDAPPEQERLIPVLQSVIRWAVRALAILMVVVIVLGVVDVAFILYQKLTNEPILILTISEVLATFGAFMAVLIAIEIFINITIYLRDDVIHVKIVMATALMAIARKVIVLDIEEVDAAEIYAIAAVLLAAGLAYWLVHRLEKGAHAGKHFE
jgi:uncharacterized membrane protein (DUF373 family)